MAQNCVILKYMRKGVLSALFVSLLLVGGAIWIRTESTVMSENDLGLASVGSQDNYGNPFNREVPTDETALAVKDSLSKTSLVSRRLITDYVHIASDGGISEADVNSLVNRYVENIPSINTSKKVVGQDITTVRDTKANFQKYDEATTKIELERHARVKTASKTAGTIGALDSSFYLMMTSISDAYRNAAHDLKEIPVPDSLLSTHLKLINNYLSSADGLKSLSMTDTDAMAGFAGMITVNENMGKEAAIIKEIMSILVKNGV